MDTDYYGQEPNPGNATVSISTFSLKELYNLIEKKMMDFKKALPLDAQQLYVTKNIGYNEGVLKRYTEKDFTRFARRKAEYGASKRAQLAIGFHKDLNMYTLALESVLSEESIKFNKWDDVSKVAQELAQTVPNRVNLDLTHHAITFANSASYVDMDGETVDTTTGDGFPIAYNAHLLAHSPVTYTNIAPAMMFSKTALRIIERLSRNNTMDNFGKPVQYKTTHIWSTNDPYNKFEIQQYIKSTSDNTQANGNVMNVDKDRYKLLTLESIDTTILGERDASKSNYWGVISLGDTLESGNRFSGIFGVWEAPHMKPFPNGSNNANDFSRDTQRYGARGRQGKAVLNGMGIVYVFAPSA